MEIIKILLAPCFLFIKNLDQYLLIGMCVWSSSIYLLIINQRCQPLQPKKKGSDIILLLVVVVVVVLVSVNSISSTINKLLL